MRAWSLLALLGLAANLPAQPPIPAHGRGYRPPPPAVTAARHAEAFKRHDSRMRAFAATVTPPAKFDCADMGWVPPIRDQGNCGSCYLVSAADCVSCAFIKAGWGKADDTFKISDQYGMDCQSFGGCGGGDEAEVIGWMKTKGFPAERYLDGSGSHSDYGPYTASEGRCGLKPGAKLWQIADWGYATGDQSNRPATVAEIKAALMQFGVLSIALDAGAFDSYSGGVITSLGNNIDHAITLTGWDDAKQAVRVRNQWSTDWGEKGYAWISYSAAPRLTEVIWVSATPLPPAPPDPTPIPPAPVPPTPVPPTPGGPVVVTLSPEQVAAVLQQAGVTSNEAALRQKMAEIQAILDSIKSRTAPSMAAKPTNAEPPLAPVDEFAVALQAAWAGETDPKKDSQRKVIADAYAEASILLRGGAVASKTVGDFYRSVDAAIQAKILDAALMKVRAALVADFNKRVAFSTSQPLDAAEKATLASEFKRQSDYLERMGK